MNHIYGWPAAAAAPRCCAVMSVRTLLLWTAIALRTASLLCTAAAAPPPSCTGAADCSLSGQCVLVPPTRPGRLLASGRCRCDAGFAGPTCASLDLRLNSTTRTLAGLPGAHVGGTVVNTVWGGHTVQDADGKWHWFGSVIMDRKPLSAWEHDSAAGHAEGSDPSNLILKELVLRPQGGDAWDAGSIHGVYLVRNPKPYPNSTDVWLLFYTGFPTRNPLGSRQIGVAHAGSLSGPWKRLGRPVLSANSNV
jgi:hypothetical protein